MQSVPASWPEAREDCGVPGRHPALAARSAVQCRQLCDLPDTPSLLAAALGRAGSAGGEERWRGFESRHLPEGALRSLRAGSFRGEGWPRGRRGQEARPVGSARFLCRLCRGQRAPARAIHTNGDGARFAPRKESQRPFGSQPISIFLCGMLGKCGWKIP